MNASGNSTKRIAAPQRPGRAWVRTVSMLLAIAVPLGLSGCLFEKKAKAVVPPQSQAPVALATPPPAGDQPLIEAPQVKVPDVPVASAASQPKRERRRPARPAPVVAAPAAPAPAPPVQVASVEGGSEGSNAIGALTAGGDAGPQAMQQAGELIASNDKRLKQLSEKKAKTQQDQLSKIKNFQRQALDALHSGDAEGAKTLATKALLLLNDLDRVGGG